jgi:amidase
VTDADGELHRLDLEEIHSRLVYGELSSAELTGYCLERIAALDRDLRAVLAADPTAMDQARRSDARHRAGHDLSPLDGIPVLVKDNIDTANLSSTAGSRLLATPPGRDADVVTRLRDAGAVILGKTNLSEWSNFRSTRATEGWSAAGGQTQNPYRPGHSPWGSSAGSAVAVATGMAPLALGTETDGSIVGPAGVCGVVGVKPELGLVPMRGIAGVSPAIDTAGPLASRVRDAATCLAVLAGQPALASLRVPLAEFRLGLWLPRGTPAPAEAALRAAAAALAVAGIGVVEIGLELPAEILADGLFALYAEFRPHIEEYLRARGTGPRDLSEMIAGNRSDPAELSVFGQDLFEDAERRPSAPGPAALAARDRSRAEARALLAGALDAGGVEAIIAPANEPAWPIDYSRGDAGKLTSSALPALAGYPNVCVPGGLVDGLPVGFCLFGQQTSARLLPLALAVERACGPRPWPSPAPTHT